MSKATPTALPVEQRQAGLSTAGLARPLKGRPFPHRCFSSQEVALPVGPIQVSVEGVLMK